MYLHVKLLEEETALPFLAITTSRYEQEITHGAIQRTELILYSLLFFQACGATCRFVVCVCVCVRECVCVCVYVCVLMCLCFCLTVPFLHV